MRQGNDGRWETDLSMKEENILVVKIVELRIREDDILEWKANTSSANTSIFSVYSSASGGGGGGFVD